MPFDVAHRELPQELDLEHASPATRLLEKRRRMFDVKEALDAQKDEFTRKVPSSDPTSRAAGASRARPTSPSLVDPLASITAMHCATLRWSKCMCKSTANKVPFSTCFHALED